MGDFYQNGIITTLHNLSKRPLEDMESELVEFSKKRPLGLILPSLYSELEGEAMPLIISELKEVPYLNQIVIGWIVPMRISTAMPSSFLSLPQDYRVLWNDGLS